MKTATKTVWIARCPKCKNHRRIERGTVVAWWNRRPDVRCDCGSAMTAKLLKGRMVSGHECNSRCTGSRGHVCECSCGGLNHGVSA